MTWTPILEGELAARTRALIDVIADEVARRAGEVNEPSLASGQAGVALLHGYRALDGAPEGADLALESIQRSLDLVMMNPTPWLFSGYAGTGFVMHQLADVIGDTGEVLAQLDELIATAVATAPWTYELELMTGIVGLGVYGLERGLSTIVDRVVAHLDARAERLDHAIAWRTIDANETVFPAGYHNLGIAHGQAGVIGFLAAAISMSPHATTLLPGALAWLSAQERADHVPRYGMMIGDRTMPRFDGVLDGWCYGDASTAITLVRAGRALGDSTWVAAGHALALVSSRRSNDERAHLTIDHSLCHGAISQAHLFNRLAQFFDDDELRTTAHQWYRRALEVPEVRDLELSLQGGLVGLGLGLLAAVSIIEPVWDRALLLAPG
ncbi:MAG: hypothetical protein NT062_34600 [Proteobacteria bacterium]|nr:hypothetical protein [Pseudomonadota bacterium]